MARPITLVLLAVGVAGFPAGCSSSSSDKPHDTREKGADAPAKTTVPAGVAAPRRVESSAAFAAKAVEKVYGRELSPGQRVVIGATCARGRCVLRYRVMARGEGLLLADEQSILRALFSRRDVRAVTLYVHHWSTGTPTKNEAPVFATTVCRRSEHPSFNWPRIRAGDITRVCHFRHNAGGQVRSQVRRGQLTNRRASKGQGGNGNGNGAGNGNGGGNGGGNGNGAGNPNQ